MLNPHGVTAGVLVGVALGGFSLWTACWLSSSHTTPSCDVAMNNQLTFSCMPLPGDVNGSELIRFLRSSASGYFLACFILHIMIEVWKSMERQPLKYCTLSVSLIVCISYGLSACSGVVPVMVSFWGRAANVMRWGHWVLILPLLVYTMDSHHGRNLDKRGFPFLAVWSYWTCLSFSFFLNTIHNVVAVTSFLTIAVMTTCTLSLVSLYNFYSCYNSYVKCKSGGDRGGKSVTQELLHVMDPDKMVQSMEECIEREAEAYSDLLSSIFKLLIVCIVVAQLLGTTDTVSVTVETFLSTILDLAALNSFFLSVLASHQQDSLKIREYLVKSDESNSATIKHFFRFMCHEIAPPLNILTSSIYRIAEWSEDFAAEAGQERVTLHENVDVSIKCCTQMYKTIEDVRNFVSVSSEGYMGAGLGSALKETLDLKKEVRRAAEHYTMRAQARGVRLILSVDGEIPNTLVGNRVHIKTAVNILIATAIDSCLPDKEVIVSLQSRGLALCSAKGAPAGNDTVAVYFSVQSCGTAGVMNADTPPASQQPRRTTASSSSTLLREQIQTNERVLNLGVAAKLIEKEGGIVTAQHDPTDNTSINAFELVLALKYSSTRAEPATPLEVLTSPGQWDGITLGNIEAKALAEIAKTAAPAPVPAVAVAAVDALAAAPKVPATSRAPDGMKKSLSSGALELLVAASSTTRVPGAGTLAGAADQGIEYTLPQTTLTRIASASSIATSESASVSVPGREASHGGGRSNSTTSLPEAGSSGPGGTGITRAGSGFSMPVEGSFRLETRSSTVLVCDDAPTNRKMCARVISRLGFAVEAAENGEQLLQMVRGNASSAMAANTFDEAAKRAKNNKSARGSAGAAAAAPSEQEHPQISPELWYHAIVLDNEMPIKTGEVTVRELRRMGYRGPVYGLTGYAMEEDVSRFKLAGCDAIFTKPLNVPALMAVLKPPEQGAPPP